MFRLYLGCYCFSLYNWGAGNWHLPKEFRHFWQVIFGGLVDAQIPLRVSLFGLLCLERDHQAIRLPTSKSQSLLAFLLLHPESHLREALAARFWGDSTDSKALHSLRTALSSIHNALGDIFIADRETVLLNPTYPLWVDVPEFENAAANDPASSLSLYQGDLLVDLYDDWILPERERLRTLYLDAISRLIQTHRSKSEYTQAIELAKRALPVILRTKRCINI